jgi:hypothetical protein
MTAVDSMYVFRKPQISKETTSGTEVTPARTLGSLEIALNPVPVVQSFSPMGNLLTTTAATNYEDTACPLRGQGDFNEIIYLYAGLIANTTPTTPGGATNAREWLFDLDSSNLQTPATFTVEAGDVTRAQRTGYLLVNDGTIAVDFEKGLQITGNAFARKVRDQKTTYLQITNGPATTGTWSFTVGAQTASSLSRTITAAALQTALEALSNVDPGDVTASGGPLGTNPIALAWAGQYATTEVPALSTADTFDAGDVTLYNLNPAATANALKSILGSQIDIWTNTTSHAALVTAASSASNALTRIFDLNFKFPNRWGPIKPLGTVNAGTFAAHAALRPKPTVAFSVGADANGMAFLANLRANSMVWMRAQALGPLIEAGQNYLWQQDMAILLNKINPIKEGQGLAQIDFEGELAHDPTWGKGLSVLVRNAMTAL